MTLYTLQFGAYVEAHDDSTVTNNMIPRKHEWTSLGPNVNIQGTQKVFDLDTGRVLNRGKVLSMVITYWLIRKMNDWCKKSKREQYERNLELLNRNK